MNQQMIKDDTKDSDKNSPNGRSLPWLYIHFPCLQLDNLLQQNPQTGKQQPLIIVNSKTNQVKQLNKPAFEHGVKVNMGIANAIALAPDLMVLDYQADSEIKQLETLALHLYQITADIIVYQPNGLLLHVESMLHLYGSLQHYWEKITDILQHTKLHYTQALATTPTAARLLAKYAPNKSVTSLTPSQMNKALGQLKVTCLEIDPKHIEQLQRLGLVYVEQLWGLSNKAIGRRFGLELLNYLQQLKQHNPKVFSNNPKVIVYQPPLHYQQSIELLHEINQASILLFPLKRMVQQMENFLLTRQLLVHEISISLHYRQLSSTTLTIASSEGEYQCEPWMRLIALKVEQCKLPDSVIAISFCCGELVQKQGHNRALLTNAYRDKQTEQTNRQITQANKLTPHQLMSILAAKVGKEHLFTLAINDDHRPQYASDYLPAGQQQSLMPDSCSIPLPWQRPTLLLHQPQPLPAGFHIIAGPERISTAWWQHNPDDSQTLSYNPLAMHRDYYIGKDNYGTLSWIYHQPNQGWFLQGYFS